MPLRVTDDHAVPAPATTPGSVPVRLRVDGAEPGVDRHVAVAVSGRPRLAWSLTGAAPESPRTRVRVLGPGGGTHWETTLAPGAPTTVRVGAPLEPFTSYTWSVSAQVGDTWATAEAALETAALTEADWTATWLSAPRGTTVVTPLPPLPRTVRAWLMVTGQGLVRAELGGAAVNAGRLDPTRTDTARALYRCYDVTDLVARGARELAVTLGAGEWARTGDDPRVLVELVAREHDRTLVRVAPSRRSVARSSRVVVDDPFYLERHASRAEGGSTAAVREVPADAVPPLPRTVRPDPTPPVRVVRTLDAFRRHVADPDVRVFDAGANVAGRARLVLDRPLPAGAEVRVVHGEHLDAAGRIDTTNLTMPFDHGRARQVLEWEGDGASRQVEPWFAYHGFRYVEVTGVPAGATARVEVDVLHTDLRPSGVVDTDSPLLTTLMERAERTLLNNVHGVPEDCPTREQAAWTGDTASVAEYELAAFDAEAFLGKWVDDLVTSALPSGEIPAVSPDVRADRLRGEPVWGAALHRVLLGHWLHHGDTELVRHALPTLRRWADFQLGCRDDDGVVSRAPISYGQDWLALEQTPAPLLHTAATIECLRVLARLEADAGDPAEAARRATQADGLVVAARRRFVDAERSIVGNGSQGSYAAAIEAGLLDDAEAAEAARRIEADVRRRGDRVSAGFGAVRWVVRALSSAGRHQVLFDALAQPAEPGIGAMLASGPGTFWECWWVDPANTGTGSLDHVGLGGPFAAWVWEGLLGLRPMSAGYGTFDLAPRLVDGVGRLAVTTPLPGGDLSVAVRRVGRRLRVDVTVPTGSTGTLRLPGHVPTPLGPGTHHHEAVVEPAVEQAGGSPEPAAPWSPPALAPVAADVDLPPFDLAALRPGAGDPTLSPRGRLRCMPVPHAQVASGVLDVEATQTGVAPSVVLPFDHPRDLSGSAFAYALVDLCRERPDTAASLWLRVRAADGTEREATARAWPASWNRVAVDLAGWAGAAQVVEIEVGLRTEGGGADPLALHGTDGAVRDGFHLGDVGASGRPRTW
ncbi:family 78 glycoside hydrolase catalytic domain [Isoptericola sp. F-RaC21]|uniref:family 78 glycoside hydrolase catalytic domain n=1 Tax=Isoptericola sp. F-RaC21 TaxID=3141452 RepID=UPI00315BD45C